MCWNQVENEKKKLRKRAGERKREGGFGKWKVEKKKGENRDIWVYVCGGEKSREKKKRMDDRKKGWKNNIKKRNDNLEILPQYFYNKF